MNQVVHQAYTYASKREKNVDGYLDGYILLGAYHGTFLGEIFKVAKRKNLLKIMRCVSHFVKPPKGMYGRNL